MAREQKNKEIEANACIWLGFAHKENNQIQTAIQHYEKALEIAITQNDKETEIMMRNAIEQFARVGGKVKLVDGILKSIWQLMGAKVNLKNTYLKNKLINGKSI